jgi:hypothetical protein
MNAAIAQKLNVLESAILEIQEWASVLWVRFVGGCKFVSKKAVAMNEYKNDEHEAFCVITGKYVEELPEIVTVNGASPFLPSKTIYKGTDITPDDVIKKSWEIERSKPGYDKKIKAIAKENTERNIALYGNEFGYLG